MSFTRNDIEFPSEVKRYPFGHFDIYVGTAFEEAVSDQAAFLSRHLLAKQPLPGAVPTAS